MKVIMPYHEIMDELDGAAILRKIERCGRVCYKSESKTTRSSYKDFVKMIIKRGHESVLEHFSFTVRFVCDRGVSHELVRHRLCSFSQESTRYCNYSKDGFGNEITVIRPWWASKVQREEYYKWEDSMVACEQSYFKALETLPPQDARANLPTSLKTEIIVTANLREWKHILILRTSPQAHPEMRRLMLPLLKELKQKIPVVFDDVSITD